MTADISKQSLEQISEDWYKYALSYDNSVVTDNFCGQLLNTITCQKCGYKSLAFDNFWDLSLSFTKGLRMLQDFQLERVIEHFLKEEMLDDMYYCGKCKQHNKSTKKFTIWRMPKILVVHLKRFTYGTFRKEKLSHNIVFPINNLQLQNLCSDSQHMSCKDTNYNLFGIVNHSGSLNGGHYKSMCKNPYDSRWYEFNDSIVREIDINSQQFDTKGSSSPYLLFYQKNIP